MTEEPENGVWEIDPDIERLCSRDGSGMFTCPAGRYCGHPSQYPDILNLETEGVINQAEIFYGIVTFDNIGIGMITIFQIITLEGWVDMMYDLMDNSQTIFSAIFFCLMVLIGSFFMLQLILAVIMGTFDSMEKDEEEEQREAELEKIEERERKTTESKAVQDKLNTEE
ncbi:hypothetical protein COB52_00360 [Candidatus Kaiserbacteria bacterium]|nr:MAG: hypothetical protein COB52_00360 [Candidatus Kaiserbacteria bacterium]